MSDDEAQTVNVDKAIINKLATVYFAVDESKALRKSIRESLKKGDEELKKVRDVLKGYQFTCVIDEGEPEKVQVPKIIQPAPLKKVVPKLITVTEMLARKTRNEFLKSPESSVEDMLFDKEDAKITPSRNAEGKKLSSTSQKRESKTSMIKSLK